MFCLFIAGGLLFTACDHDGLASPTDKEKARDIVREREVYTPSNDIEGRNYNERQRIADDPTTILWCTFFPQNPSAQIFTVPISGKLTSSSKRPWDNVRWSSASGAFFNEPSPDGFYGSSSPYRYGLGPGGEYSDFTDLPSYCSTQPMVFQRQETTIVLEVDEDLLAGHEAAREALAKGDGAEAERLLAESISAASIEDEETAPTTTIIETE